MTAHDPFAEQRAALAGNHGVLSLAVYCFAVEYDPICGLALLVRSRRVGKQSDVLPVASFRVQDRQPGLPVRIESPRRNLRENPIGGFLSIFSIDV